MSAATAPTTAATSSSRADADELGRDERLLPRVLEQLRELERLAVGRDLRRDRRPHARRDRLSGERDLATFDARA